MQICSNRFGLRSLKIFADSQQQQQQQQQQRGIPVPLPAVALRSIFFCECRILLNVEQIVVQLNSAIPRNNNNNNKLTGASNRREAPVNLLSRALESTPSESQWFAQC